MKKYLDILSEIERKIREGGYPPGRKLPSVRSAAKLYRCSAGTVMRAYAELEKRHAIYSVPQSGFYAVGMSRDRRDDRDGDSIDFATGLPDADAFPYLDFQHCLNKAIDTYKNDLFTYGHPQGLESLRHTLVSHFADDQVFAKAERIVIVSGAQQAMELLTKMPFPNGKTAILVEQPSYDLYLRYLEREGVPTYGIARTAAGIDLRELERRFASGDIKLFYTMSRYHNPLGTTYPAEVRKAIAELAAEYDVYVLEDDYMADLGTERRFDPIHAYGSSHVIYLKSFSKIIFPGLRVGAVVLPERLLKTYHAYKIYPDTSLLSQAALEVYIKNGMYARHKHKISTLYESRMRVLMESFERHNDPGRMEAPHLGSGIYAHVKLKSPINLDRLVKRLAEKNIRVVSGKSFYLTDHSERDRFLRISVSRAQAEQIDEGVAAIVEEIR